MVFVMICIVGPYSSAPPTRAEVHSDSAAPEIARWIGELRSQQLAPDGVTFTTVMQARKPRFGWLPIGSMYGIYANIWGIWMVNVTIYSIHGSYGYSIL